MLKCILHIILFKITHVIYGEQTYILLCLFELEFYKKLLVSVDVS